MFNWYWLPLFPMFVIFFISALAETNRPPFDLVEADSDLVAGYAVEYSATPFLLFFLGEYIAILTDVRHGDHPGLGGWLPPFAVAPFIWVPGVIWFAFKCMFMFFMFAMVKAIVPRYRYDQPCGWAGRCSCRFRLRWSRSSRASCSIRRWCRDDGGAA